MGDRAFSTIDEVIEALYSVVSGEAGEERDWALERRVMHPEGRLMRTGVDEDGNSWTHVFDTEGFIEATRPLLEELPFYETEIARHVERFGNLAAVRSVYEARRHPEDGAPFQRGVNFLHLFHDGTRWWVMSICWDNEREGLRLPSDWV